MNLTSHEISTQVERTLKRTFEILAALTSATLDYLNQMTQLQSKNSEKSSKSFKKIPTKYQDMILVASSIGDITMVNYNDKAVKFFKCSNKIERQVMLNNRFEIEGI